MHGTEDSSSSFRWFHRSHSEDSPSNKNIARSTELTACCTSSTISSSRCEAVEYSICAEHTHTHKRSSEARKLTQTCLCHKTVRNEEINHSFQRRRAEAPATHHSACACTQLTVSLSFSIFSSSDKLQMTPDLKSSHGASDQINSSHGNLTCRSHCGQSLHSSSRLVVPAFSALSDDAPAL